MFAFADTGALRTVASNPVVDRSGVRFHVALHAEVIAHGGPYELIGHINHGIDCGKQKRVAYYPRMMNDFERHMLPIGFNYFVYKQRKAELQLMLTEMRLVATGGMPFEAVQT